MGQSSYYKLLNIAGAFIINLLLPFQIIIFALSILVGADSLLGVIRAFKFKVFSSAKFKRIITKILLYLITILICTVVDTFVLTEIGISFQITQYVIALLCLTEFFSCLENLSDLGVKIPYIYIFTKLKNAIPFLPNPRQLSNKMNKAIDRASESIPDTYNQIYHTWVNYSLTFTEENMNQKLTEDQLLTIVDCQKTTLLVLLKRKVNEPNILKYIDYLIKLYNEYPPISKDNLFLLVNKGVLFGFQ